MYSPLFITNHVLRHDSINSLIDTVFINSLDRKEFLSTILCSKECNDTPEQHIKAIQAPYSSFWSFIIRKTRRHLPDFLFNLPDSYIYTWLNNACKAGRKPIIDGQVNYLHSISVPFTPHLVALKLKKKYGIPWVAHFLEPWSDNTYRKFNWITDKINCRMEREVAKYADIIIHNSEEMCESWKERYGRLVEGKQFSIPLCYWSPIPTVIEREKSSKIRISHIGNLYGLRNGQNFLKALSRTITQHPELKDSVSVTFVGKVSEDDIRLANSSGLSEIVSFKGQMTEEECVKYYRETDLFLVIESSRQGKLFFTSKVIQYYMYEKPILGLVADGSVLNKEMNRNGHTAIPEDNIEEIASFLHHAITDYDSLFQFNRDAKQKFFPETIATQYQQIIKSGFPNL